MVSDSFRVPLQTFGQVRSLREERHTDSGKPEVILTFTDVLILLSWLAMIAMFLTKLLHNFNHHVLKGLHSFRPIYE